MTFTGTRATSDVPGSLGISRYWPHGSGLCHWSWWYPEATFTDAPVLVCFHGGDLGNNPGWASMTTNFFTGKRLALAEALHALGWVIVSVEYPVTSKFRHQALPGGDEGGARILGSYEEVWPLAQWPEQPGFFALAVQQIKTNWSATDPLSGPRSVELLGAGNSIDRDRIWVLADDWAATCALYAFLQPTGMYQFESQIAHTSMDRYAPRASHRVAGIIGLNPGPLDFTQFHVLSGYGQPDEIPYYLRNDRFHPMMRAEGARRWSTTPSSWKTQSPWWVLQETHYENANLKLYLDFEENGTGIGGAGLYDTDLSSDDWSPGTLLSTAGRQWLNPADGRVQAAAIREALSTFGAPETTSATPIRNSIVRDAVSGSAWPTISTPASWAEEVVELMT
ncbi:MAG: hypothetical protein EKK62_09545 [Acidimicrobiia bacterium]|nr:MAG: hypothetical protein EKK62_09545 [Acidimicrobiia bacterium]